MGAVFQYQQLMRELSYAVAQNYLHKLLYRFKPGSTVILQQAMPGAWPYKYRPFNFKLVLEDLLQLYQPKKIYIYIYISMCSIKHRQKTLNE